MVKNSANADATCVHASTPESGYDSKASLLSEASKSSFADSATGEADRGVGAAVLVGVISTCSTVVEAMLGATRECVEGERGSTAKSASSRKPKVGAAEA